MRLENLKQEYSSCMKCKDLCETRTQVVFGFGNPNADVVFIGEAPGAKEDQSGVPFCGASGKVLDELLEEINLKREDIFITNTIICRPPKNRNPKKEEIIQCHDRLKKTLEIISPKVIVTVGNFATRVIMPEIGKQGITKIRGQVFKINFDGRDYTVVPVIHPANYLYKGRSPVVFEQMKQDFETIKNVISTKFEKLDES